MRKSVFFGAVIVLLSLLHSTAAIPAFPGAEGFGASATGGRGGRVIKVTTLAASGAGKRKMLFLFSSQSSRDRFFTSSA
jgi:pectate lyase